MTWTSALQSRAQELLPLLERQQCQVVWRSDTMTETSTEPFLTGACWLEIWKSGTLITFAGPVSCPPSQDTVDAALVMVIEQAVHLLRLRPP